MDDQYFPEKDFIAVCPRPDLARGHPRCKKSLTVLLCDIQNVYNRNTFELAFSKSIFQYVFLQTSFVNVMGMMADEANLTLYPAIRGAFLSYLMANSNCFPNPISIIFLRVFNSRSDLLFSILEM